MTSPSTLSDLLAPSGTGRPAFIYCKKCSRAYDYCAPNYRSIHACLSPRQVSSGSTAGSETDQAKKASISNSNNNLNNRKQMLDLSKHCGVIIGPSGVPCMRSLTCKSHSMSSKRAIRGRAKDFDILLAEYLQQHPPKNLPKTVSAAVNFDLMPKVDLEPADLSFEQLDSASSSFPPKVPAHMYCSLKRRRAVSRYRSIFAFLDRSRPNNKINRPL